MVFPIFFLKKLIYEKVSRQKICKIKSYLDYIQIHCGVLKKINLFFNFQENLQRVNLYSLDIDQAGYSVRPDLDPDYIYLQIYQLTINDAPKIKILTSFFM